MSHIMARFNLHLALALITAIFVSYTCAANGRGGSSRSIDASSGSVNNYFQTPAFWTDAQYGKGWGGWSMAASNIEYQIKTATHQDVQLSGDFLHDSFQGALRRVVVNADDSKYEQLEAGTSGDQLAEFGKVRPKTNLIDQDAHVIKDLSDTLEEQTMKNIENGVAKETLSQISLPKELQQLLPSNQNDAGSLVAGFCKESDQPVVPIDAFLDPALQPACARNKYRSHSGFCNNICFPNRGRESSTFLRNLAPDYADKKSGLRVSSSKKPLPSARLVSSRVITQTIDDAPTWTAMFTQFGQFLAHDLTSTAQERPRCCGVAKGKQSPDCIPITIPRDDPFYSKFGEKCMECARSRIGVRIGCRLGHREQLNQNSAYIDGSAIYGVNDALIFQVRDTSAGSKGRLEVSAPFANNPAYHLLPGAEKSALTNDTVVCLDKTPGKPCFIAGDERCNTQAGLQTTHTLFVRHHNNIVNKLSGFPETSDWSDEKFYQEARAIIAAQLQHITYNEFLPVLLGPLVVNERGLAVLKTGRFRGYDVTVDAGLSNEFSTAAYRVGHSMVQSRLVRMNANFQEVGTIPLRTTFFKAGNIYKQGMIDELVRGMATLPGKKISDSVTPDLSQSLFPNPKTPQFGHDLVSLNIQRGRDHGINGYMEWRKLCKLPTANSFEALKKLNVMPSQVVDKLKSVYESVADIDLYPAGLSENRDADGLVGKTFSCILAEQFGRLRTGDRFWYENDLPLPSRLTNEQLKAIRQTSMASIICSTTTNLKAIQPRVFETITQLGNKRVDCSSIPGLDLQPWRRA